MDHDKRTVWCPPIRTLLGLAEKLVIVGEGHAVTVTVVWVDDGEPHADVAVKVYVVVFCG
jgi:hypothetical protein